jgi:hypothetical protein
VEVRTVKPGTYKHTITGLTPNTVYKVTVRAKNIKASPFVDEKSLVRLLEKLSAHTEFRTLNKAKCARWRMALIAPFNVHSIVKEEKKKKLNSVSRKYWSDLDA